MRLLMACLFLLISFKAQALPMWTYDLAGKITGPDHAADYLRDVSVGDGFWIRMFVQQKSMGVQDVGLVGRIGDWLFSYNSAHGLSYSGDWSPERWSALTNYDFAPPAAHYGSIPATQLILTLFGFDESGHAEMPEEDWLVKRNGWIDPSRFLRGNISLYFWAPFDTPEGVRWDEVDLGGEVTSFTQVPEPKSLALLVLGFLGLVYLPRLGRSHYSCNSIVC